MGDEAKPEKARREGIFWRKCGGFIMKENLHLNFIRVVIEVMRIMTINDLYHHSNRGVKAHLLTKHLPIHIIFRFQLLSSSNRTRCRIFIEHWKIRGHVISRAAFPDWEAVFSIGADRLRLFLSFSASIDFSPLRDFSLSLLVNLSGGLLDGLSVRICWLSV